MSDDVTYSPQAFEAAQARLKRAPAELTDADLEQLAIVDPALAQHGLVQRFKALHPDPAPVPREVPAARLDVDAVAAAVIDVIGKAIAPLVARLEDQQQRIAVLERQPALKFAGPHRAETHYLAGAIVQKQGLWLAEADTHATPGEEDSGWRLILKAAPK